MNKETRRLVLRVSLLSGLLACGIAAKADIIVYTSLDNGTTGAFVAPLGANNTYTGTYSAFAVPFQPTATEYLSSIQLDLYHNPDGVNGIGTESSTAIVNLVSDNSGSPGALLESFTVPTTLGDTGILTLESAANPLLSTGSTYWIEALPGDNLFIGSWAQTNDPVYAFDYNNGSGWVAQCAPCNPAPAIAVRGSDAPSGSQTPEPSTGVLIGTGLALTLFLGRRVGLAIPSPNSETITGKLLASVFRTRIPGCDPDRRGTGGEITGFPQRS